MGNKSCNVQKIEHIVATGKCKRKTNISFTIDQFHQQNISSDLIWFDLSLSPSKLTESNPWPVMAIILSQMNLNGAVWIFLIVAEDWHGYSLLKGQACFESDSIGWTEGKGWGNVDWRKRVKKEYRLKEKDERKEWGRDIEE